MQLPLAVGIFAQVLCRTEPQISQQSNEVSLIIPASVKVSKDSASFENLARWRHELDIQVPERDMRERGIDLDKFR